MTSIEIVSQNGTGDTLVDGWLFTHTAELDLVTDGDW
jgi:hypothetical protein